MRPNLIFVFAVALQIIFGSCSDDFPSECKASQDRCRELQYKIDQSTGAEKEQYRQFYLTEKHYLEICLKSN